MTASSGVSSSCSSCLTASSVSRPACATARIEMTFQRGALLELMSQKFVTRHAELGRPHQPQSHRVDDTHADNLKTALKIVRCAGARLEDQFRCHHAEPLSCACRNAPTSPPHAGSLQHRSILGPPNAASTNDQRTHSIRREWRNSRPPDHVRGIGGAAPRGRADPRPRACVPPQEQRSSPIGTESAFRSIDARCRATGGLACGDALSRLLGSQCGGNFVTLARMVSADKVFGFPWRDVFWVPVFQFDLSDLSLKRTPQEVRTELGRNFDGWELATWFTSPNVWLQDRPPVDLLDSDSLSVLKAARADRFVVEG